MNAKIIRAFAAAAILATAAHSPARAQTPPEIRQDTVKSDFEALGDYLGYWRSDEKTPQNGGRAFRFEYELATFDPAESIAKMTIRQVFADGEKKLWWIGFKGWDPVEQETYYVAFSPLGRVSKGKFAQMGAAFITYYRAFDSQGQEVELRDVFSPVTDGEYANVTYLRATGENEWRIVARDTWRRVE